MIHDIWDAGSMYFWCFLLLLWIFLGYHFLVSYLDWKEEVELRREERKEKVEVESKKAKDYIHG